MKIEKKFRFYAAHRNETIQDKCNSLHGHTYHITCVFDVKRDPSNPSISQLFSAYDAIEMHLKRRWDHALLLSSVDPIAEDLYRILGDTQRVVVISRPTSVENVCYELWYEITGLLQFTNLSEIRLQETETSVMIYTSADYAEDTAAFNEIPPPPCECVFDEKGICVVCGGTEFQYRRRNRKNAGRN